MLVLIKSRSCQTNNSKTLFTLNTDCSRINLSNDAIFNPNDATFQFSNQGIIMDNIESLEREMTKNSGCLILTSNLDFHETKEVTKLLQSSKLTNGNGILIIEHLEGLEPTLRCCCHRSPCFSIEEKDVYLRTNNISNANSKAFHHLCSNCFRHDQKLAGRSRDRCRSHY